MKRIFTSAFILSVMFFYQSILLPIFASAESTPRISITNTPTKEKDSEKLIKVKTTIVTKKTETEKTDIEPVVETKTQKRDIELSSDVDKILKEMDIDDTDPLAETKKVDAIYKPAKKNFLWIAFSIVLFPVILFVLLIKAMQLAKTRFEKEEKEKGLSKEEKLLDELEKEQKKTKKKHRSLSDILGGTKQKLYESNAFEDDFDREDEDFEFMVEEVVLVEENISEEQSVSEPQIIQPEEPEAEQAPEPVKPKKEKVQKAEPEEPNNVVEESTETDNPVIDTFEIDNNLKFLLIKKDDSCNLVCNLQGREIVIMNLDKAQKFNKVRKIDSKPGRDVYMVKLDSWRGLVEVKEDSVKYLMDI